MTIVSSIIFSLLSLSLSPRLGLQLRADEADIVPWSCVLAYVVYIAVPATLLIFPSAVPTQ